MKSKGLAKGWVNNAWEHSPEVLLEQGVCCYAGRRIYSQLHIAISPYPADGILSAFVVIFIISFSISSSSGLDIIKYQHSSKLWPLAATFFGDTSII